MRRLAAALLLALTAPTIALACTGVVLTDDHSVIVGGNEDWVRWDAWMWASSPGEGVHGVVYFGYEIRGEWGERAPFWYEFHGVNDQGLYFDSFGAPCVAPRSTLGNPWRGEHLMARAMEECSTTEEAVALFTSSNLLFMQCQQFLFVDRRGTAAVIEGDEVVWMDGSSLALTNFYLSDPTLGGYPCWRYDRVTSMLAQDAAATPGRAAELLEAASHPGTRYSLVVDLVQGLGEVYYAHDFANPLCLDLFALAAVGCERLLLSNIMDGEHDAVSGFVCGE